MRFPRVCKSPLLCQLSYRPCERVYAGVGGILSEPPPSTSGLGHGPFKAGARVRIPLGARAVSSVGRAPALQAGGRWFEPGTAHLMAGDAWAPLGAEWRRKLPRHGPFEREQMLVEFAKGRRVVHVGFVDERRMEDKLARGRWLHARLDEVASSLVGLDVSEEGVARAREQGFDAYTVDAQSADAVEALGLRPAEVVIAGEVIEHLDAPGPFLGTMHKLVDADGVLVLTTPNAYRLLNFLAPATGVELIHPDHTAWHSPHTLRNLLERNGWDVEGMAYYRNASPALDGWKGALAKGGRAVLGGIGKLAPYWSDGLIVWAHPRVGTEAR
jgi:SAM-dependent methyltransferase